MWNPTSNLDTFTWARTAVACIFGTVTYLFLLVIYRVYFHPLAKFPGPFLGKVTGWNAIGASLKGESTRTRYRWLKEYGNVVRIGPNELLFGDIPSIKDIYGQSSQICNKDPDFYGPFSVTGARNVFNSYDRLEHSRIRRLLSHGFSMVGVTKFEPRIEVIIERFLKTAESATQPINLFDPVHYLFLDIVSELSFDRSFNCLSGELSQEAEDTDAWLNISAIKGMVPWIEWVPTKFVQESVRAAPRLIKFARECVHDFGTRIENKTADDGSLLRRMFEAKDAETGSTFSELELMENSLIFIQAGAGTSSPTVLYFIYEVDKIPSVRENLYREIRTAFPDPSVFPDYKTLDKLPYLNKVFNETLRRRGPLPVNLPRISPGKFISGHYVPAGTLVGNIAYSTHHNPAYFPDPFKFDPERWENPTPDMKAAFRPFGTGPRNCIGMNLARVQIFLTLGALYQRYDIRVDPFTTEDDMFESDRGVLMPHKRQVWVHIHAKN